MNLVEFGVIGYTFSEVMRQFYSHENEEFMPNITDKRLVMVGKESLKDDMDLSIMFTE